MRELLDATDSYELTAWGEFFRVKQERDEQARKDRAFEAQYGE